MKNKILSNIFGHIVGYKKYGECYLEMYIFFNQFNKEGLGFNFYDQPRHKTKDGSVAYANDLKINIEYDFDKIEKFYSLLWEKDKEEHRKDYSCFLSFEVTRLDDWFNRDMKNEYSTKFKPFKAWLRTAKEPNKVKEVPQTLHDIFTKDEKNNYESIINKLKPKYISNKNEWVGEKIKTAVAIIEVFRRKGYFSAAYKTKKAAEIARVFSGTFKGINCSSLNTELKPNKMYVDKNFKVYTEVLKTEIEIVSKIFR